VAAGASYAAVNQTSIDLSAEAVKVMASGSGPPRLPVSSPSMAATSSVVSSNASKFSAMRWGLVDFGMT
jgi:hypothetical protein